MKLRLAVVATFAALAFAGAVQAEIPKGWFPAGSKPQNYEMGLEAHGGAKVAFIREKTGETTPGDFGTLMQSVDATPYRGKRLRLSAALKTTAAQRAQMWMRVDGRARPVAFDNMADRPVTGSTDWKRYHVVLDVPADAVAVAYGFFLAGTGKVSADEFRLEVVGPETPVTGRSTTPRNLSFEESRLLDGTALG